MVEYKKAALSLHELNRRDRQWLLKRLSSAHRRELRKALLELDKLGIPQQQGWLSALESAKAGMADADPGSPAWAAATLDNSLARANADRVKRILAQEPDIVVATVLAGGDWPWSREILSVYKGAQRKRLEKLQIQRRKDVPEKVTRSLLRALARRLDLEAVATPIGLNGERHGSLIGFARRFPWQR